MNKKQSRTAKPVKAKKDKREQKDPNALPDKTMALIESETVKVSKNVGFGFHEEEDFRQMLCLEAIKARESYEAAKGMSLESYLYMALKGEIKNYLDARLHNKNKTNLLIVLDAPLSEDGEGGPDEAEATKLDLVPDADGSGRDVTDLRLDVQNAIKALAFDKDSEVRKYAPQVCVLLMNGVTQKDLPKHIGLKFNRIRFSLMPKLVKAFKKAFER